MENIAPVNALNRRSRQLLQWGFIVFAVGALVTVLGLLFTTIRLIPTIHPLFGFYNFVTNLVYAIGLIIIAASLVLVVRAFTRRKENDLALITGNVINQSGYFDGRYSFIRNVNRTGLGYIDAVLIGPPGVLVFRILDNRGNFANEAANWMSQNADGSWAPARISPTRECVDDIQHVRQYLTRHTLGSVPVFGLIVFTAGETSVRIAEKESIVPITHLNTVVQNFGKQYLAVADRMPQESVTAVRRLMLE
jgi:hypothetical protein